MSAIHIFVGPSLPPGARRELAEVVFHPPAAQGDVYALVSSRPFAIGIVDGYFERVPAVWHKEILWALSEGVHVFGASSMGALRATELSEFGMVGVGHVFDQFDRGLLNDDDEVTLVHAEEASDYRPGSEALVNIRATLFKAEGAGLLSPLESEQLVNEAKATFYPDRNYASVLASARRLLSAPRGEQLSSWLRQADNRVDVKRQDALELVRALTDFRASDPGPKRVQWAFHHTDAWEQVRRTVKLDTESATSAPMRSALEQLGLDEEHRAQARTLSSLRTARVEIARRAGLTPTPAELAAALAQLVERKGLGDAAGLRDWMRAWKLSPAELERLLGDEVRASKAELIRSTSEQQALIDYLLVSGTVR